jgi:hypothetical protein
MSEICFYENIMSDQSIDNFKNEYWNILLKNTDKDELIINRNEEILCPMGKILHQILEKLNDKSKYIEYWSREVSKYLDFHIDCDEMSLKNNKLFLKPNKGHVLYLDNEIYFPTILLDNSDNIIISPNKKGRLLRFNGDLYHGTGIRDIYFNTKDNLKKRHVILFNTWNDDNYNIKKNIIYKPTIYVINKYNKNNIIINDLKSWVKIDPIVSIDCEYDYMFKFNLLRQKNQRILENIPKKFNDDIINTKIIKIFVSDDMIEYYEDEIIIPYIFKILIK